MPFTPKAPQLTLTNDTTDVDVVDAPASGEIRMVRSIVVHNADTSAVDVTLKIDVSGTERIIARDKTLSADASLYYEVPTNLGSTDKIQAVLGAAVAANQCHVTATFADWS